MSTVLESLNAALHHSLMEDQRVFLIGEDILDPYGGAFKVTRGLSSSFPNRVWTAPLSEAGFVGLATGMAMRGLRPVVEIMFGDFLTLIFDQIVNHACKFRWMYNEQVHVPLVIRTPMGGRRGYGPTHSQTLEKHFLGIPGLIVLAPCTLGNPGDLLKKAIFDINDPVLFIENKLLYPMEILDDTAIQDEFRIQVIPHTNVTYFPKSNEHMNSRNYSPAYLLSVNGAPPPFATIVAYGYMADLARQAVLDLAYQHEVFVELVVLTQLSPFWIEPILASTFRTSRLLTVEEGTLSLGWGAEILALVSQQLGSRLRVTRRVGAFDLPIPSSGPLESEILPGIKQITSACLEMI